jgi:hypothetical protein
MGGINLEDHFGKPLPEAQQLPHELRAHQFMDLANDSMPLSFPRVTFHAFYLTGMEIFQGEQAVKGLKMLDDPKMTEYDDPDLKELLQEQIETGNRADIESATQAKVQCSMLSDQEEELEEALRKLTLLAAEKGGSLGDVERSKNILRGIAKRRPDMDLDSLSKEFALTSYFIFD